MRSVLAVLSVALFLICSVHVQSGLTKSKPSHNCSDVRLIPVNGDAPCVCTFSTSEPLDGALVWWVGNQVVATGRHGVTSLRFPSEKLSGYHLGMSKTCRVKYSEGSMSSAVYLPEGVAYGPDHVTLRYDKVKDTGGLQYIRVLCDVSLFYPMAVDMIEWGGQCQGQEDITCSLTPEEADGKEVRCRVTNFANNKRTVEAAVTISLSGGVDSGWRNSSLVLLDKSAESGKQNNNNSGLQLLNCDGHIMSRSPGLVSLRPFLGLRPSDIRVRCDGLSGQPGSTVHWTLSTHTGYTLDLGNCTGGRCSSNDLDLEMKHAGTRSSVNFDEYPRELNGLLSCTEQTPDGGSKSASCSFGYVYVATLDGCELRIDHEKWTLVITCRVRHLYPLHAYHLHLTEFHQNTRFSSRIPTRAPFPTPPVYVTTPYVNDTDRRMYYSVTAVYRRPLSARNDVIYSYQLRVTPGFTSLLSDPDSQLHVVRPAKLVIRCTRTLRVINHVLSTMSRMCFCSTTSVGSPPGRLLWLLGERVRYTSHYGVTYLEFPVEESAVPEEGMLITCRLDWIQRQTSSIMLRRDNASSAESESAAAEGGAGATAERGGDFLPGLGGNGTGQGSSPGKMEMSGHEGLTTMEMLGVGVVILFILIVIVFVVIVIVMWKRGRRRHHAKSTNLAVSFNSLSLRSLSRGRRHRSLFPDTAGYTIVPADSDPDENIYDSVDDLHGRGDDDFLDEDAETLGAAVVRVGKVGRSGSLGNRQGEGCVYLTPAHDLYLTAVNDRGLVPRNDLYLTPTRGEQGF